ncbi:MAG: glycosyltransferase [Lachnospiraceae bacterium]|nr:glycosyltransferase [Lachnospiraceae bacterium]
MVCISVVVPVYNIEAYIGECIESIIAQSYKNLEIILVDDGSEDSSGIICDAYARKDSRIQVIHKENGGLVSARKAGLSIAKGEYISCVDGDDWIEPQMYQKLLALNPDVDVIAFAGVEEYGIPGQSGIKRNTIKEGLYEGEKDRYQLYRCMMVNDSFYVNGILTYLWCKLVRRTLLIQCQMEVPDSVSYAEDAACVYPCLLKAKSIYVCNESFYHYRVRPGSMVKEQVGVEKLVGLFGTLAKSFLAHPLKESLMRQLQYFMWHGMLLKQYRQIRHSMVLYPFRKVKKGMKVAVYGAGIFGKVIWKYGQETGDIVITGWFDQRCEVYRTRNLPVQPAEEVTGAAFDVVVIAILDVRLAMKIERQFVHMGIPVERIDYIRMEVLEKMQLPDYMEEILTGKV